MASSILMAVFIYWSNNAFKKYSEQPLSTQIKFRFGDDNLGNISLPAFTVCYVRQKSAAQKLNCGFNATDLLDFYKQCLDAGVKVSDINYALTKSSGVQAFAEIHPKILVGQEAEEKQHLFWSLVFLRKYGFCHTFDPRIVPGKGLDLVTLLILMWFNMEN